jgi:hypothetical protein
VKKLKARIVCGFFWYGHGLAMFRYPSGDALSDSKFQTVDYFRMRIHGGAKHKFVPLEYVDETGIALHQRGGKFDNAVQDFMKTVRRPQADADLMEHVNM